MGLQLPHGLALQKRHTGNARTQGSTQGTFSECWGGCKGPSSALAAKVWAQGEMELKAKPPSTRLTPKRRARCSGWCCTLVHLPSWLLYQPRPPKMPLPLACGRDRKRCGHNEKSTCSLTQFRGATQHRLQKPPLGSHSYSQTLGNGQRKWVFPSQPRSSDQRKASRPLVLNGTRIIGRSGSGELCLHPWHRLFTLVQHFSDALSSCFTLKCYILTGEERGSRFHAPVV